MITRFKHRAEALGATLLFKLLGALPIDTASAIGSVLGRIIGPRMRAQRIARHNLTMAFPEWSAQQREACLNAMWDNLGRTAAEMAHLPNDKFIERLHLAQPEYTTPQDKTALFFSGHIGNWELLPSIAFKQGMPLTIIYREANNPIVDKLIAKLRAFRCKDMFPKGRSGAVKMARTIRNHGHIAMLVDQKMNDGIPVPFFGRDAMTAPAIAELALRYDLPLIPTRIIRKQGVHFEGMLYPPLTITRTDDQQADILAIMTQINAILEQWIREDPSQWFWVHKRWPN
jgi:Kdo2-lipid IVA lauroyltransferase/acyltransferase